MLPAVTCFLPNSGVNVLGGGDWDHMQCSQDHRLPQHCRPRSSTELHGPVALRTVPSHEELLGSPCHSSKMSRKPSLTQNSTKSREALTFHTFPECVLDVLQS